MMDKLFKRNYLGLLFLLAKLKVGYLDIVYASFFINTSLLRAIKETVSSKNLEITSS